jgi:hypothetical protein
MHGKTTIKIIRYLVVLHGIYTSSLLRLNNTTIWNPLILKKNKHSVWHCVFFSRHFCRHDTTRRREVLTRKPSGRQQAKQEGMIERHCYQWRLLLGKWMLRHSHYSSWLLVLSGITVTCIYLDRHLQWGFGFTFSASAAVTSAPLHLILVIKCNERHCTSGLQGNRWVLKLFWV